MGEGTGSGDPSGAAGAGASGDHREGRVDPELAPVLEELPEASDPYEDVEATRADLRETLAAFPADRSGVRSERYRIARPEGGELTVEVYRPAGVTGVLPGVLHFHGGGFAFGRSLPGQDRAAIGLCRELPAVVVVVEYRLAPEHRHPAAVDDCYRALEWVAERAAELGVDPARIGVAGKSAGAGLSAAVALMARDRGGPGLVHQSLCVPYVDDRPGGLPTDADPQVALKQLVGEVWEHYLPPGATADAYAAPARADDLSGLPPAHVLVCDLDPVRDAGLAYARRLMDAGVTVTVRNVPGAWHGFELYAPESRAAREMTAQCTREIRAALYAE